MFVVVLHDLRVELHFGAVLAYQDEILDEDVGLGGERLEQVRHTKIEKGTPYVQRVWFSW